MEPESKTKAVVVPENQAGLFLLLENEAAYDKGYDDGWDARDDIASRAEKAEYDRGWIAGVQAALDRNRSVG